MRDVLLLIVLLAAPPTLGVCGFRVAMKWIYDVEMPLKRSLLLVLLMHLIQGVAAGLGWFFLEMFLVTDPTARTGVYLAAVALSGIPVVIACTEASWTGGAAVALVTILIEAGSLLGIWILVIAVQHFAERLAA